MADHKCGKFLSARVAPAGSGRLGAKSLWQVIPPRSLKICHAYRAREVVAAGWAGGGCYAGVQATKLTERGGRGDGTRRKRGTAAGQLGHRYISM